MKISNEAPSFTETADGRRYPQDGTRIGPAWSAMWEILRDGEWHVREELINEGMRAGSIAWQTGYNLLWQAQRSEILEKQRLKKITYFRVGK